MRRRNGFSQTQAITLILAFAFIGINAKDIPKKDINRSTKQICPESVDKSGIYVIGDKRLCNVYHECDCRYANKTCTLLKSNVCSKGQVFSNETLKCESIEIVGCETSYLQWVDGFSKDQRMNQSWLLERDEEQRNTKYERVKEATPLTDINYFMCPPGSNNRYADPYICNIFHVCVTRGEQTYDQPFLCPYGSVFRIVDANTMFCDRRRESDCVGTSFYRGSDDENKSQMASQLLIKEDTMSKFSCGKNGIVEDPIYCNTYHKCLNGVDEHYVCENQLLYNPMSTLCDYPINVACGKKQLYKRTAFVQTENKIDPSKAAPKSASLIQNKVQSQLPVSLSSNSTFAIIHGVKIYLNCPSGAKNALIPDPKYCNVFHHCHSGTGNVFTCEKGQAFDGSANGPEKSGVCNFEDMVNCLGKFILTEGGQRSGAPAKISATVPVNAAMPQSVQPALANPLPNSRVSGISPAYLMPSLPSTREEVINGITFDCKGKANGHWRDTRYCDVFHACISGEQRKTYSCAQLGERVFFDESTKKCDFVRNSPMGCPNGQFYGQVTLPNTQQSMVPDEPADGWKQFIRSRESFSCAGKADGFYASRWCNVFYRCFIGLKSEFLCPRMMNTDRLWWVQHGSPQETAQTSAACVWPCETKKQCSSPGGIVVENNGQYSESVTEAERVWRSSNCVDDPSVNDIFRIPDADTNCNGVPDGNFVESKYCNVFHRCTNGKRKDFQCAKATNSPYDLWWNQATNQCDWPCKVNCNKPIYGSSKSSSQIQQEDRSLNEEECRGFQPPVFTTTTALPIPSRPIPKPFPDDPYICMGVGLFLSPKICNVYYDCKQAGQPPVAAFYCDNGFFDNISKTCKPQNQVRCPYEPATLFPFISIQEPNAPEDVGCDNFGYYIIHSNRFCNLYYVCDGNSGKPQTFRCYDRQNLEDAVYNRETKKCESKSGTGCQGEILPSRQRYQSSPIDHTRIPELQPLSCRADQQYLAEHDKYCNLYHSCILGRYQMYACVTIGSFDKTSYFYYTNGDCSAPNANQCGPNKSVFPYDKLSITDMMFSQNYAQQANQQYFAPIVAPSIAQSGQANYGSIALKNSIEPVMDCDFGSNYLVSHKKYCNLFYECSGGKLRLNICVDQSTNSFGGIFDKNTGKCKPYNSMECPTNALFNPEGDVKKAEVPSAKNEAAPKMNVLNTESSFSCMGKPNGYYESEWCNVFFRCLNGKRIDTKCGPGQKGTEYVYDLWWEHQNGTYDAARPRAFYGSDEEAKCEWPCKVKCNKPIWTFGESKQSAESISALDTQTRPECAVGGVARSAQLIFHGASLGANQRTGDFRAYETENSNPSGFFCENDGTFKDPLFCNIYHICMNKQRRTFHCRQYDTDGTGKAASIYDATKNACVSRDDGIASCNGLIYDPNYMNLPAYKDLPRIPRACEKAGVFKVKDGETLYCDMFYWCEKVNAEPLFFQCQSAVFGKGVSFYNAEKKQCDSSANVQCPFPNKLYSAPTGSSIPSLAQPQPNQGHLNAALPPQDPAPGYHSIPSNQFQTSFTCQNTAPGYYPNPEYCDLFHYCYANGQFKTYVCASMQNRYQLWWSHQTEPGRRDNIFCDWPCNMIGPNTICPAHKRVLMRDRLQVPGGISQQEVVQSTCPNTGPIFAPTTAPAPVEHWPPMPPVHPYEPPQVHPQPYEPPQVHPQPYEPPQVHPSFSQHSFQQSEPIFPQTNFNPNLFVSTPTIRCNTEYRVHGFSPDPRDCSKYYRCDQNVGMDAMSTGYLMSCFAGLWWDQSRRMCVSPSEVPCNPYNIITDHVAETSPTFPIHPSESNGNGNNLGQGAPCKLLSCAQAGLSMKNHMKSIRGKPGSFLKCDGQCAVEMCCPLDLVFDDNTQRCEWTQNQARMASLRSAGPEKKCDCEEKKETLKTLVTNEKKAN